MPKSACRSASQRRGLARLVGPVDQVQPFLAARQVKHNVGERPARASSRIFMASGRAVERIVIIARMSYRVSVIGLHGLAILRKLELVGPVL